LTPIRLPLTTHNRRLRAEGRSLSQDKQWNNIWLLFLTEDYYLKEIMKEEIACEQARRNI
jgi:hypothetical protein